MLYNPSTKIALNKQMRLVQNGVFIGTWTFKWKNAYFSVL